MIFNVGDYLDAEEMQVDVESVDERIEELKAERDEFEATGGELDCDSAQELKELLGFRRAVSDAACGFYDTVEIVPDKAFERYVRWEAEAEYGVSADGIGDYVDWERYAQDRKDGFASVKLADGSQVWVKA